MAAIDAFADGEPVLFGSPTEPIAFVAVRAEAIDAATLERLHDLGGGIVVLALGNSIGEQLALQPAPATERRRLELPFTPSIDAAGVLDGGWSLSDRALTMRVAAHPSSGPADIEIPGHVHPVRVPDNHLVERGGAIAAAVDLSYSAGHRAAVALCAVVDRAAPAPFAEIRGRRALSGLPVVDSEEVRGQARARATYEAAVDCLLPVRGSSFRAIAHSDDGAGGPLLALVHGDPGAQARALVHVHAGCMLGDVFGSLLCPCHAQLDLAIAEITAVGAGVVLYRKAEPSGDLDCRRGAAIDAPVAAGLLTRAGVARIRLAGSTPGLDTELRALGLDVEDGEALRYVA
jgi:3,4-dihydroxy 2-butanone 4-phosphate synthase / GTP cyclohydrolase II